jgi:hypothetical protein
MKKLEPDLVIRHLGKTSKLRRFTIDFHIIKFKNLQTKWFKRDKITVEKRSRLIRILIWNEIETFARDRAPCGIFRTSIYALWVPYNSEVQNEMWRDEDIMRIGKMWIEKYSVSSISLKKFLEVVSKFSHILSLCKINNLLESENMNVTIKWWSNEL